MAAARKISPYGYLSDVAPGPIFIGVEKPMKTYTIDNILFTNAKVSDDVVYKLIETMENNKADMVAVAPNLREFTAAGLYKKLQQFPVPPRRLEVLQGQEHRGQGLSSERSSVQPADAAEPALRRVPGDRHCDRYSAGAAARLRRRLGARRAAAAVRTGVLHRAAAGGVHGAFARAVLHQQYARKPGRFDWGGAIASFGIAAYLVYRFTTSAGIPLALIPCLGLTLVWTVVGSRAWAMRWFDWLAAALSLVICLYITVRYEPLTYEIAMLPLEGIIGSAILVLLVLEATRRTAGATLVGIILMLIVYVFIGPHLPGDFATRPVTPERLLVYLGLDVNGMIGPLLGVAVLIVVPFTLMGQVLGRTGGAAYFADIAMSAMGHFRGGAAKIAVVGSALFGMISGAAVSNVVAVGIVTIPLMVRSGFSPYRAAAIESVGSTGGQLMPPVMGAAAFIMAEFLQVSYGAVCIAAVIPSLLYYAALFMHVDLEAAKHKIGAAQVDETCRRSSRSSNPAGISRSRSRF